MEIVVDNKTARIGILRLILAFIVVPTLGSLLAVGLTRPMLGLIVPADLVERLQGNFSLRGSDTVSVTLIGLQIALSILLATLYIVPILRCSIRGSGTAASFSLTARRRILNAPYVFGLISLLTWGGSLVINIVFDPFTRGIDVPVFSWLWPIIYLVLPASIYIIVVFHISEWMIRRFIIPLVFPDGRLSKVGGVLRITLQRRLFLLYYALFIFPVGVMLLIVLNQSGLYQQRLSRDFLLQIGTVTILMSLFSVLLWRIISRAILRPIGIISQSAREVRSGNLQVSTPAQSRDELGDLAENIDEMTVGLREKEMIEDAFGRAVDPLVRDYLVSGGVSMGGELREVTVLFADIRGFTTLSEQMAPKINVAMLNRYFEAMSACVRSRHGLVNKYIGDAIMAIFGAPLDIGNHAEAAIRTALEMREALVVFNRENRTMGLPELHIGIGLHSGTVVAGAVGAHDRHEYTVIGDVVNVASRVEGLCKASKTDFLFTESTRALARSIENIRPVGLASIRGRKQKVRLYSL